MEKRDAQRSQVGASLVPMVQAAQKDLSIISPYFVPGDVVTQALTEMAGTGKKVSVLTNSLAANDVAAVHGGYSRYRKPLLEGGVQLWELKPVGGNAAQSSLFGSSGASLHTKAFAVDDHLLFVGSYNLDPRSTWLNCEQGVMVEDTVLTAQLRVVLQKQTEGQHAWRVTLGEGGLAWSDGNDSYDSEPRAPFGRRFQAWLSRVLHLDEQL